MRLLTCSVRCAWVALPLTVLLAPPPSAAAEELTFNLPGRTFATGDRIVSVSVFQWFSSSGGQLTGPWRPVEGRQNWTGQTDFWVRQIKDIMDANIDVMYVHLIPGWEQERINLFEAMAQLRSQGYEVPKAVPFLDPAITWSILPAIDLATTAGKDQWAAQYIRFFNQYYSRNTDAQADSYLGIINGRVMLDTWGMEGVNGVTNWQSLSRSDVESRLAAAFGSQHAAFNQGVYQVASVYGGYPSWADELIFQFCCNEYFMERSGPQTPTYMLKAGYWDQNIRNPGAFLARGGGVHYTQGWQALLNDSPRRNRVYIESWNEYDEGSGIYAAATGPPYIVPPNPNTDSWSSTNKPREYIDTTATYAAQYNGLPQRDAAFLGHTVPAVVYPGTRADVSIVVRNQGNAEWTGAGQYKLALQGPTLFKWGFDADAQGWVLGRNAFGTSGNTAYENGDWGAGYGFTGGGLRTRTGNVDGTDYTNGASTAWRRTFHLDRSTNVSIRFRWRLFLPAAMDANENGEARFEVDDHAYGLNGQSYLARLLGGTGVDQDTGWQDSCIVVGLTGPADHTLEIGGWNSRKTESNELVDVYVDDVALADADAPSPWGSSRVLIDDLQDDIPTCGGIFRGRAKAFNLQLTAPTTPGSYELHFQMVQELVAWFGPRLDLSIEVPPAAVSPSPSDGATNVDPATLLIWTAGPGAVGHQVYLGLDEAAVASAAPGSPEFLGTLPIGSQSIDPPGRLHQGASYYWRVDELQPAGPPVNGTIWSFTTFVIPGDFDEDGDVDQEDFGHLQACLDGWGDPQAAGCQDADLNHDTFVDQYDVDLFRQCFSGPGVPVEPECAN